MGFYDRSRDLVIRLLSNYGQPMTVCRVLQTTPYDPINPVSTPLRLLDQEQTVGAVVPATDSLLQRFEAQLVGDSLARTSFRYVLLSGTKTVFPQQDDHLLTNEGAYRILGLTAIDPDGTGVSLYEMGCTLDVNFVIPSGDENARVFATQDGVPLGTQDGELLITQP